MKRIFLLLICISGFSQDYLEEVTKVYDNGKPMFIDYLDIEDLKKVKTTRFDELGNKIFSISFNKESGLPDGEFFDLINKGYFDNGVLNCDDCMLVESNSPSVFSYDYDNQNTLITKGSVVNGRFNGKVEKYGYLDKYKFSYGFYMSKRYSTSGFKGIDSDDDTIFVKIPSEFIFYNQDGQIEGKYTKELNGKKITFDVVNGITKSYVSKDSDGLIVDSLSNDNKIWKINYKFRKNDGFIVFPGFSSINKSTNDKLFYDINSSIIPNNSNREEEVNRFNGGFGIIPIGGDSSSFDIDENDLIPYTGGKPSILDKNGLYSGFKRCLEETYLESLYIGVESFSRSYDNDIYSKYYNTNNCLIWKPGKFDNLFTVVYNYLVNDTPTFNTKKFKYQYDGHYGKIFVDILNSNKESNVYKKNLKSSVNDISDLPSFFEKNISVSDYLRSIQELLLSDKIEVQELYVWDYPLKKYVLVDFENLIKISESKFNNKIVEKTNKTRTFDWSDYEVWYTSDRNGDGEYVSEMESWVKNDKFITKMEQLGYKYDYSDKNTYYRVFLKDSQTFNNYKLNEKNKLISKDQNELFIIFSVKN
jgi:hypothetical protein